MLRNVRKNGDVTSPSFEIEENDIQVEVLPDSHFLGTCLQSVRSLKETIYDEVVHKAQNTLQEIFDREFDTVRHIRRSLEHIQRERHNRLKRKMVSSTLFSILS